MTNEHRIGDYLQKNGDIYKIMPFGIHNEELEKYGLLSMFLEASTGEINSLGYLIDKQDTSYLQATQEQIQMFKNVISNNEIMDEDEKKSILED